MTTASTGSSAATSSARSDSGTSGRPGVNWRTAAAAVLPAFNEQAIIERTVRHVADVLRGLASEFEVIVTNDGSRDNTGAILADLQQRAPELHLRVVTHERNRGYGAALASGFDAARK